MTARTLILSTLVLATASCAAGRQHERLAAQLDAYSIPKPLAEVWPEALRYVNDRGYDLVGNDRTAIGLPEEGAWEKFLGKGHETQKSRRQWRAETAANRKGDQYRLIGTETGPSSCRIEFHGVNAGDWVRRGEIDAGPREFRDVDLERAFIGSIDPEAASRLDRSPRAAPAEPGARRPTKIGIIGSGKIGGTLASLWAKAGHEVLLSSRHPESLKELAASLGPRARVGTPREAAEFGEVVLVSVPYKALPEIGRDLGQALKGKVVLDTGNPYPERDGEMALEARRKGTGVASAEYLPGVRLVRAFNAISFRNLRSEAHRSGERVGIPIAADDREALAVATRLVEDAGFDPVVVGPLSKARLFDVGTPVYTQLLTARELKERLGP